MAYDEDLADRIRELLDPDLPLDERSMFGGLAFLVGGNMAVVASGKGGIMVRVDPDRTATLLDPAKGVTPMVMGGGETKGWLRVDAEHVRTARQLRRWVRIGVDRARALPPKAAARSRSRAASGRRRP